MPRERAYSDPTSPRLDGPSTFLPSSPTLANPERLIRPPLHQTSTSRTTESLSRHSGTILTGQSLAQYAGEVHGPEWPYASGSHDSRWRQGRAGDGSVTPSVTSVSADGDEDGLDMSLTEDKLSSWRAKGKGRAMEVDDAGNDIAQLGSLAGSLPPEILIHICRLLSEKDLSNALLVSRFWSTCVYRVLWHAPVIASLRQLIFLTRTLSSFSPLTFSYAKAVRRLNLSAVANSLGDYVILGLEQCTRVEKLTLAGAENLSSRGIRRLVRGMTELTSVDLSGSPNVDDRLLEDLFENSRNLHGVNLSDCKHIGDQGVRAIARLGRSLRKLKLVDCKTVTDSAFIHVIQSCPHITELELSSIPLMTNATVHAILYHLGYLRELKLCNNEGLTEDAFPNLIELRCPESPGKNPLLPEYVEAGGLLDTPVSREGLLDLRTVDLTGCKLLRDSSVHNLVKSAPRLRQLHLTKCDSLTDESLMSVAMLGRNLHHFHLGHVSLITDAGMTTLVRSCTRIRYMDLTCCNLLTDLAISELASNLVKLRRIGLVKLNNLTDESIQSLASRHETLERCHLSFCPNITIKAIAMLLNRCPLLGHLSLSGVAAFKDAEYRQYCRPTPSDVSDRQAASYCVFSGHGIAALRKHLNAQMAAECFYTSNRSSRRESDSSGSSTAPSPTPPSQYYEHVGSSRGSPFRSTPADYRLDRDATWRALPGLPGTAFVSSGAFYHPEITQAQRPPRVPARGSSAFNPVAERQRARRLSRDDLEDALRQSRLNTIELDDEYEEENPEEGFRNVRAGPMRTLLVDQAMQEADDPISTSFGPMQHSVVEEESSSGLAGPGLTSTRSLSFRDHLDGENGRTNAALRWVRDNVRRWGSNGSEGPVRRPTS